MATNNGDANGEASYRPLPFPQQQVNQVEIPQLNMPMYRGQVRQFSPNLGIENGGKRAGIPPYRPPVSPYLQIPFGRPPNHPVGQQNFGTTNHVRSHARSLSQPVAFSMDSLPPLSPSLYKTDQFTADVFMDEKSGSSRPFLPTTPFTRGISSMVGDSLPPRKTHRRSNSDVPFGFSSVMQSPVSVASPGVLDRSVSAREISAKPAHLVLKGAESNGEGNGKRKTEREGSDLVSTYMNVDNMDVLNSSDEKLAPENQEDGKETSGGTNGIGNMQTPGVYLSDEMRVGLNSDAFGDIASTTRHHRSVSMDSFMGNINCAEDSFGVLPSPGAMPGQLSPASSIDASSDARSLEFGNGKFSSAELQKIMSNEKLSEIAKTDPKRAKRILANRQAAARSKERKVRYTAEMEHKVLTLESETTTMSAQITKLQRDYGVQSTINHELRISVQSMEQQLQLQDATTQELLAELQQWRNPSTGFNGGFQQLSISSQSSERTISNVQHSLQQSDADTLQQSNGDTAASP